jgi:hypothetical protein
MTKDILKEGILSAHKLPVAHTQNHLHRGGGNTQRTIPPDVILVYIHQLIAQNLYFVSVHKISTWIKQSLKDSTTNQTAEAMLPLIMQLNT